MPMTMQQSDFQDYVVKHARANATISEGHMVVAVEEYLSAGGAFLKPEWAEKVRTNGLLGTFDWPTVSAIFTKIVDQTWAADEETEAEQKARMKAALRREPDWIVARRRKRVQASA